MTDEPGSADPSRLLRQLQWRYAVKRFDHTRSIPAEIWQTLERCLILTPSSYGLQPWKFIVITNQAIKKRLPAISWNQQQPQDCSHMVVFAARRGLDAIYVDSFFEKVREVRCLPPDALGGYRNMLVNTIQAMPSHLDWNARQAYIALGQLMVTAAMLSIDTCPMEGINHLEYDKLLGLDASDYTTVVACAVGYRHTEDEQAKAAKVRFDSSDVIVRWD